MILPLCSLARNPDGSLVRPTAYEINAATVETALVAAGAVLLIVLVMAGMSLARRRHLISIGLGVLGALLISIHPKWTIDTRGGDCGITQVLASWLVLGILVIFLVTQVLLALASRTSYTQERQDFEERFRPRNPG